MSMKQLLPPVPYNTPVTGSDAILSVPWRGFFTKLSEGALNILGSSMSDSASPGYVGELLTANSSGVTVGTSGSLKLLASLSLTAGDWDVEGLGSVSLSGFTTTVIEVAISKNSSSLDQSGVGGVASHPASAIAMNVPTGPRRISLAQTTTVYLLGSVTYSGGSGSWSTNSHIRARRMR